MASSPISIFQLESGVQSGVYNMALDECLLEWVRQKESAATPILIVRTYEWDQPTMSLGVNQRERDLNRIWQGFIPTMPAFVRRPTGGRAILHGEDIAFSFITNDPALLNCPLKDSYCVLTKFVKETLIELGVRVADSCESNSRAYTLSSACFETQTPSDLVDTEGRKLCGSAQLRRAGGLLQHGSAFINPYQIAPQQFTQVLFRAVAQYYGQPEAPSFRPDDEFQEQLDRLKKAYSKESTEILDRASTTEGSHLDPASR